MLLMRRRNVHNLFTLCVLLLLCCSGPVSSLDCPEKCVCNSTTVKCVSQNLMSIPRRLPENTTTFFFTGNNLSHLTVDSFPVLLEQLTALYLSGNQIEQVDARVFDNLPNLHLLDLNNNRILNFSSHAFPENNTLRVLNMSQSLYNGSYTLSNLFKHSVPKLSRLDLSNNDLILIPDVIASLPNLTSLDLRHNSIVSVYNVTFRSQVLNFLDLRDNSLKNIPNGTLTDLSQLAELQMHLAGNTWFCDCNIKDMVIWLQKSEFVVDKANMTCFGPTELRGTTLILLDQTKLQCADSGDMKGVLETSYVFLGMVLALIGVIFLLVLYLNRKGIKRWIYNIRDACRDHMEGYHYRYEINSDPRLANLSLNSDV
ncbi:trophoblast glycoprotein [Hoplias malabaricus]|uniref:trophoblast glycoprotein n=1 Tax=Hoplias malabaricus TaxID=27720 RepID=UPI003462052B